MTTGIRSDASGTFGALTFGGDDAVTFDDTGIKAGSYKAGSIVAADFADGALIENAPAGIGYGTGAGGTVTQATSKSTAVTLNKPCGQITTEATALAAGTEVIFLLNNSLFATSDNVVVTLGSAGTYNAYVVRVVSTNAGQIYIALKNVTGGSLSEAILINFAIIKGATA